MPPNPPRRRIAATLALLATLAFATVVVAEDAGPPAAAVTQPDQPPPPPTLDGTTQPPPPAALEVVQALRHGDWRLVAAAALSTIMLALRDARERWKWLRGDRGGALLVMGLSILGALVASLYAGAPIDGWLVLTAVAIAWTAVGGYTWIRRLIWPADQAPAADTNVTIRSVVVDGADPDRFMRGVTDAIARGTPPPGAPPSSTPPAAPAAPAPGTGGV